jgi:acetyltransferase
MIVSNREVMSEIAQKFDPLFNPRSLTLIGASANPYKWGSLILSHIITGHFRGRVYPINPREKEILSLKVYSSVKSLPETPDLAVVVTPPSSVPQVLQECAGKGIKAAVIITAGFAEIGAEGEKLQQEVVSIARESGMILVGPNCFGIISTACSLSALMPPLFPQPGPFGVVSQSGNMGFSIVQRLISKGFGISKLISYGNEADLHLEDYLEYLAEDSETKVILSYIEGFKDGRKFFEIAKKVTQKKPIVTLKAGYTSAGARAARSHTAALAGSDAIFDSVCRQAGIIRVRDVDEMFNVGAALVHQPLPRGKRVGIITDGGGWGVLGADACVSAGLSVAQLPEETIKELDSLLPSWWSRGNPVDLAAGVFGENVMKAIEVMLRCATIDGLMLLNLSPLLPSGLVLVSSEAPNLRESLEAFTNSLAEVLEQLTLLMAKYSKPIVIAASEFDSGYMDAQLSRMAVQRGIPWYILPNHAAVVLSRLAQYAEYRGNLSPHGSSVFEPNAKIAKTLS